MNRRGFFLSCLSHAVSAAAISVAAIAGDVNYHRKPLRLSVVKGDPGEALMCALRADKKAPVIRVDGVRQLYAKTADEGAGFVTRMKLSPEDNLLVDATGDVVEETVYGKVEIEIIDSDALQWARWAKSTDGKVRRV